MAVSVDQDRAIQLVSIGEELNELTQRFNTEVRERRFKVRNVPRPDGTAEYHHLLNRDVSGGRLVTVVYDGFQMTFLENKDARHRSEYEYWIWFRIVDDPYEIRYKVLQTHLRFVANLNYIYFYAGLLGDHYDYIVDDDYSECGMEEEPLIEPTDEEVDRKLTPLSRVNPRVSRQSAIPTAIWYCFRRTLYYFLRYLDEQDAIVYDEDEKIWRQVIINEIQVDEDGCRCGVKKNIDDDTIEFVELRNVRLLYDQCNDCSLFFPIFNTHTFDCQAMV